MVTLADYAVATPDNKLTIVGSFYAVYAQAFPCVHRRCYFVSTVNFAAHEAGRTYKSKLELTDQDGKPLAMASEFEMIVPFAAQGFALCNLVIEIEGWPLSAAGVYTASLWLEGNVITHATLHAMQAPK